MTDQAKLDRIKARIRALASKTTERGCTEAEASAAAALVEKLLEEYDLTMTETEARDTKCRIYKFFSGSKVKDSLFLVVGPLAAFADCKAWSVTTPGRELVYNFFGADSDVAAVEYLFPLIREAIDSEAMRYRLAVGGSTKSFRLGMAYRIGQRLAALQEERKNARAASGSTNLVILKTAVVDEELKGLGLNFTPARYKPQTRDREGFVRGAAAGDRVALSRSLASE